MGRLSKLNLHKRLSKSEYEDKRSRLQLELLGAQQALRDSGRSVVIVFEGWDAAGKGGAIKRLVERLDPRGYRVVPVGEPSEEENARHFLWRFWKHLPPRGQITIFDRSWYGRVLVERVERLTPREVWRAAYDEINAFEEGLVRDGSILLKFWMHLSKDEQLRRFRERESNPFKRWKIGVEDWRNRRRWGKYVEAAEEMFDRTDTARAPWRLVESEYKWVGRIKVMRETADALHAATRSPRKKRR